MSEPESSEPESKVKRKFYSPTTRGFYDTDIHGDNMPKDAVEITEDEWMQLLEAESSGRILDHGADGRPLARERNNDELADSIRHARDNQLSQTDWLVARHRDEVEAERDTTLSAETYKALQKWRADLRALTKLPDFPRVELPPRPQGVPA